MKEVTMWNLNVFLSVMMTLSFLKDKTSEDITKLNRRQP